LELSRAERAYLFEMAGRRDPDVAAPEPAADAPASLLAMMTALVQPAYGLDRLWNACCWSPAAAQLFAGWLGDGRQRNLLRYVFLDPSAHVLIPQWRDSARRVLAEFRADYGRNLADPRVGALVAGLRRDSELFAADWDAQTVLDRAGGVRVFEHPHDGPLRFEQYTFTPPDRPDYKLVVLTPA